MSMAAVLLAMTPLVSTGAAPVVADAQSSARGAIAVTASAAARILKPAIVVFASSAPKAGKGAVKPQRRIERSENAPASTTVWIEFS